MYYLSGTLAYSPVAILNNLTENQVLLQPIMFGIKSIHWILPVHSISIDTMSIPQEQNLPSPAKSLLPADSFLHQIIIPGGQTGRIQDQYLSCMS